MIAVFWRFFTKRFPPRKYVFYVSMLVAAVLSALAPLRTEPGPGLVAAVGAAVALFALLFFLRAVDEVKDRDYDREFNPRRPVVTGEVTTTDIRTYLLVSAAVALAAAAVAGLAPVLVAVAAMAFSLFLCWLETSWDRFDASMWRNIALTVQLKTVLLCLVVALGPSVPVVPTALVLLSIVLGYLHWEIARKTVRAEFALSGEKLYSTAAGAAGALTVVGVLQVLACGLQAVVAVSAGQAGPQLLLFLLPLPFTACGLVKFARTTGERYAPAGWTLLGYIALLASMILFRLTTW
ncbi:hypothetical protein GCM10027271_43970 [Saccharopolyspora gloriosae]|uniref:4-hydroxybenzoate polyprenyltransferase n=1 Tax=Saccharopolyspora gloriosae TaxID=455344 RepID=A0A840NJF1_9PSEU|nr:UbiA family prenyltransferase [Saccharopolyspora gloriosae]MBB5070303.1 4-hydroxybenzoate polyprenyltransferase [Saccharopolyspora gloriosae]